jgi:hypothetical protein
MSDVAAFAAAVTAIKFVGGAISVISPTASSSLEANQSDACLIARALLFCSNLIECDCAAIKSLAISQADNGASR